MKSFRQVLMAAFVPGMAERGYQYRESAGDRDIIFGFAKDLGDGIEARVLIQRHQVNERPTGRSFTVSLQRVQSARPRARSNYNAWDGRLDMRLPAVMWLVYGARIFPTPDFWWNPLDVAGLEVAFLDVLARLDEYGLPWLEDLDSRMPGLLPVEEIARFEAAVARIMGPHLRERGFEPWPDDRPGMFWYRRSAGDVSAFVGFLVGPLPNSPRQAFWIKLHRNSGEKMDWDIRDAALLDQDLESLMFLKQVAAGVGPRSPAGPRYTFADEDEMAAALEDALGTLREHGLPLLETTTGKQGQRLPYWGVEL